MPQSESVWKYNLQVVQNGESKDSFVKVSLNDYLFMANELSDRVTDIADINPDIIVFDEESELLALLMSNSTKSSILRSLPEKEFPEGKTVLFVTNQNTDGTILRKVEEIKQTHPDLNCYTAALFEQKDSGQTVDLVIQKTNSKIIFPLELNLKNRNKFGLITEIISSFMISKKGEPSLDLVSSIEKLKEMGFRDENIPSLENSFFVQVLISKIRSRYNEIYGKKIRSSVLQKMLGINYQQESF